MKKVKPMMIDLRKLNDKAFVKIRKAKGKKQDKEIQNLGIFLALIEATGGKKGVSATKKQIEKIYNDEGLFFQILSEFMVREGSLEAKYNKQGRILNLKATPKGLKETEKLLKSIKK